jgi:hypothetical protein
MLVIRPEQMKIFEENARRRFEDEMVAHTKGFAPQLANVLGDEQLRIAVRSAIGRAERHGFTCRGPIRLYIEFMFQFGSSFGDDPQYPQIARLIESDGNEMQRAERLYEMCINYLDKVAGPDAENTCKALRELLTFTRRPIDFTEDDWQPRLRDTLKQIYPQKAAYSGEGGLGTLFQEAIAEAQKYGFTSVRHRVLMVVLMFAFGHGCTHDPLYPWIERTLTDDKVVDAASRADRFERKAATWLEHEVAGYDQGLQG